MSDFLGIEGSEDMKGDRLREKVMRRWTYMFYK